MPHSYRRQGLLLALRAFMVLFIFEAFLYAASAVSPQVHSILAEHPETASAFVDDPILGHRPNPNYPGHDARGFRNAEAYDQADIVALGDSQTYGAGVEPNEAWPQVLGESTGKRVYNQAFGGYGPAHSLALLDEALELAPEVVIEAMYAGNDLYDSYSLVYLRDVFPELKTDDAEVASEIVQLEQAGPLQGTVQRLFKGPSRGRLRNFVASYSKTWAMARAFNRARRRRSADNEWEYWRNRASASTSEWLVVESDSQRTILTPSYRLTALSLDDTRIREGERIAHQALLQISKRVPTRFVVALIPTKELVFANVVSAAGVATPDYVKLIALEQRLWRETKAFLESNDIEYIDTLPALEEALAEGVSAYRITNDGHPGPEGQALISGQIQSRLEELGWLSPP
jgi:lysophospholipase L1-like esterase